MRKQINVGKGIAVLDTEEIYTGQEKPDADEKLVRKAIGLLVTKQLVYYPDKRDGQSKVNITSYRILEMYDTSEPWYLIEITTETGQTVKIHSAYLSEMQKPSFIEDMAAQEAGS